MVEEGQSAIRIGYCQGGWGGRIRRERVCRKKCEKTLDKTVGRVYLPVQNSETVQL